METIQKKYSFMIIEEDNMCNPNGDPATKYGEPRVLSDKLCMISSNSLKRTIRDYIEYMYPNSTLCISREDSPDFKAMKTRLYTNNDIKQAAKAGDINKIKKLACKKYIDARAFGLVVNHAKGEEKNIASKDFKIDSYGITGPVTIDDTLSVFPVKKEEKAITCSFNRNDDGITPESSSMGGSRFIIRHGLFPIFGGISPRNAETTGFSEDDAIMIKEAIAHMYDDNTSDSRPAGTRTLRAFIWWEQKKTNYISDGTLKMSVHIDLKKGVEIPRSILDYRITIDSSIRDITDIIIDDGANIEFS